ncbi:MAG: hypothetical protein ACI97A_003823 [Planctomycetota bacterium]|jgi:hypothetical protein
MQDSERKPYDWNNEVILGWPESMDRSCLRWGEFAAAELLVQLARGPH